MYAPEWILKPMLALLERFVSMTGSYGLAIILLTVAVRILILPLTIYQTKAMKKMQEVQPVMKELQEKYKDDPEKLNQEMISLYREKGANPLAGCLPALIQMPLLFAVFVTLQNFDPGTLGVGVSFLWIDSLNSPDYILAGLSVASMLLQTVLTGAANDPNQKFMMLIMPLMIGYISFKMQAGVVLYWVVSTFFGITQQAIYPGYPRFRTGGGAKGEAGA